jgi:hypothetical protein
MAILLISETADQIEHYEAVIRLLEANGYGQPAGRLSHVAARMGDIVVNMWESQELLDLFTQTLVPLIHETGGTTPHLHVHPVHDLVTAWFVGRTRRPSRGRTR